VRAVLSHRIALVPTAAQEVLCARQWGCPALLTTGRWPSGSGSTKQAEKPSEAALRRQLNSIKRQQFPWMRLVPKSVPQQAIKNCGAAFQRFFKKQGRYPKFKNKGVRDSARFDNGPGTFECDGKPLVPQQQDLFRLWSHLGRTTVVDPGGACGTFRTRTREASRLVFSGTHILSRKESHFSSTNRG